MKKRVWSTYNKSLVERANLTFYIDENILKCDRKIKTFGRPRIFSHPLIQLLLILKIQYSLTYRMLEGFAKNILSRLYPNISLPHYSIICRRAAELEKQLPKISLRRPQVVLKMRLELRFMAKANGKSRCMVKLKEENGLSFI